VKKYTKKDNEEKMNYKGGAKEGKGGKNPSI
jgi:hypothetical protein